MFSVNIPIGLPPALKSNFRTFNKHALLSYLPQEHLHHKLMFYTVNLGILEPSIPISDYRWFHVSRKRSSYFSKRIIFLDIDLHYKITSSFKMFKNLSRILIFSFILLLKNSRYTN